jgi:hypothetical protein
MATMAPRGRLPRTNGRDRPRAQGGVRKRQYRLPDASSVRRLGRGRLAAPPGKPEPAQGDPRTPRVVELLRKAIEWQILLETCEIVNKADISRQEGITRARVTQIMGMLRLAPEIQERILSMPDGIGRTSLTEHQGAVR